MKKHFFFLTAVLLISFACKKQPEANFTVSDNTPSAGQQIYFTNSSVDGISYSWDFGDGTSSSDENPSHAYTSSGQYIVTLTAYSKKEKKMDAYSVSINVESTFDKLIGIWDMDINIVNTYENGVLQNSDTTSLVNMGFIGTIEFKTDFTYDVTISGFPPANETWSILVEEETLIFGSDTTEIVTLNSNYFNSVQVDTYTIGVDDYIDSNFTILTR